jgi:hypothetical protein
LVGVIIMDYPEGYLRPSDLLLPFIEFKQIDKSKLNPKTLCWLKHWELFDLATSPRDDEERKLIRYGHYLGWFERNGPKELDFYYDTMTDMLTIEGIRYNGEIFRQWSEHGAPIGTKLEIIARENGVITFKKIH